MGIHEKYDLKKEWEEPRQARAPIPAKSLQTVPRRTDGFVSLHLWIVTGFHVGYALVSLFLLWIGIQVFLNPIPADQLDFPAPWDHPIGIFLMVITGGLVIFMYWALLLLKGLLVVLPYLLLGLGLLSIPHLFIAIRLRSHSTIARVASIVWHSFGLVLFPAGTLISAYVLWVLLNRNTLVLFNVRGRINHSKS